jgi:hypothetical protein
MPEHGDYDAGSCRWYCSSWQSLKEWKDIHDYQPSDPSSETGDPSKRGKAEKPEREYD